MDKIVTKALKFAVVAHGDQKRKYTDLPYVTHTIDVAQLVHDHGGTIEQVAAALLHDVVEDTDFTLDDICIKFGTTIADLVFWLTDQSTLEDGNRAVRKAIDRKHILSAPAQAQIIKLADLVDNTACIGKNDPGFAKVYFLEKQLILNGMLDTVKQTPLFKIAQKQIKG